MRPEDPEEEPVHDPAPGAQRFVHDEAFELEWGEELPGFTLAWESWGGLNDDASNAILLHTGLSASSHAKRTQTNHEPGWWEAFIGPGRPLDTNRFFVVCTNVLGGCYGSTGPASIDPRTGAPFATGFPVITVPDMVRAQLKLLDHLGIEKLYASIGSSLGGMQSAALAALAPERVGRLVSISATGRSYTMSIAMRYAQRAAVMADPNWNGGRYYDGEIPRAGMKVARAVGTITYRSGPDWDERFGRRRREPRPVLGVDFEVESYVEHQGEKFCDTYDANSYLYISKAMDLFDLGHGFGSLAAGLARIRAPSLIIGVSSDMLFPVWQQRELASYIERSGTPCTYVELDVPYGHDTFLVMVDDVGGPIAKHLEK